MKTDQQTYTLPDFIVGFLRTGEQGDMSDFQVDALFKFMEHEELLSALPMLDENEKPVLTESHDLTKYGIMACECRTVIFANNTV